MIRSLTAVLATLFCAPLWAFGTGVSSYPLMLDSSLLSAEFTGVTSTGGGVGMQARYTRKVTSGIVLDAGAGFGGGERERRFFVGSDFEIFPDYMSQPRVSIKTTYANKKEFDTRQNAVSIAPTVSKGFSFWGEEAYPFIALPYTVSLIGANNTYVTSANLNLGIAGALPIEGYRHLTGSFEINASIKDSYSGVFLGISYPL